jgi:hypothetical protein
MLPLPAGDAGFFVCWIEVLLMLGASDDLSVALASFAHKVKDKSKIKTRGLRPPTAPYSFTGLKEYAEKGLRCAGHVCASREWSRKYNSRFQVSCQQQA